MILERFKVPAKDQVLVSEAALRRTGPEIFEKLGVSKEDSAEAADVVLTNSEGVTLVVAADGSTVRDLTVTSDTPQDGVILRATGRNVSYANVAVLNGTSG